MQNFKEIVGCIHIHSTYSDGTGTIPEIAGIAGEVDLDYLMMTDHHNLRAIANGEERWYGKVLSIIGYEINDIDDTNHYLAFGLTEEVDRNLPAPEYVTQVKKRGGFGIIAHPDEKRTRLVEHPPYPWTAWESTDYQGIEIWNQMSEWMEGLTPWNKFWRFINPRRSIIAPTALTLNRWDGVNQIREVVGIGGVDAHAHKHKMLGGLIEVTVFRYKIQFQTVRTHLLVPQSFEAGMPVDKAKQMIYDALLASRVFVSNYFNGEARGFSFTAENRTRQVTLGDRLEIDKETYLKVSLPAAALVRLIRNGEIVEQQTGQQVVFKIYQPGQYRLEVFRKKRAWIYSNHIRMVSAS